MSVFMISMRVRVSVSMVMVMVMFLHSTNSNSGSSLIGPRPVLDGFVVLAAMLRVEVGRAAPFGARLEPVQEWCYVGVAHEADAKGVDAVVYMLFWKSA
jgi:hypothetical protein